MIKKRIVEVLEYHPAWPALFAAEREILDGVLGNVAVAIHHIGSTSVPGLAAKPIIDILPEVTSLNELDRLNPAMEAAGYQVRGEYGIPGRRFFVRGNPERKVNVHAFQTGDPGLTRHLAFRDYLIAHPEVAAEYAALKKQVAADCNHDIERYCDGKDAFVKEHEARALRWRESR